MDEQAVGVVGDNVGDVGGGVCAFQDHGVFHQAGQKRTGGWRGRWVLGKRKHVGGTGDR